MTTFTVFGQPATKGSTVSFMGKNGIVTKSDCKNLAAWTQAVGWAARAAQVPLSPAGFPVVVNAEFRFVRPKKLRRDFPTVRPDLDKLARALLDALTGVAYVDDAQVVNLSLSKGYGDTSQMIVTIICDDDCRPICGTTGLPRGRRRCAVPRGRQYPIVEK